MLSLEADFALSIIAVPVCPLLQLQLLTFLSGRVRVRDNSSCVCSQMTPALKGSHWCPLVTVGQSLPKRHCGGLWLLRMHVLHQDAMRCSNQQTFAASYGIKVRNNCQLTTVVSSQRGRLLVQLFIYNKMSIIDSFVWLKRRLLTTYYCSPRKLQQPTACGGLWPIFPDVTWSSSGLATLGSLDEMLILIWWSRYGWDLSL